MGQKTDVVRTCVQNTTHVTRLALGPPDLRSTSERTPQLQLVL